MKRLYIAAAFLLLSVGLCIFEQYTVTTSYENATQIIDTAIEEVRNGDYEKAQESCHTLQEYWSQRQRYMAPIIEHGALDDASSTISALEYLAESKSDSLSDELITAKNQVKAIYENQKITFGNVF